MGSFNVKTEQNDLKIRFYCGFIPKNMIVVNKPFFEKMCKEGCVNYEKKYSCPPLSPEFKELVKDCEGLFIILFSCNLNQINSTEYNKIRIANIVMKARIEKLMRHLEKRFNTSFLSTGSCRLCKPCKLKLKLPCKYPKRKRYSLEATGINCNELSENLFNIKLLWYQNKKSPEYTCVICGLLCGKNQAKGIRKEMVNFINKKFIY